MQQWQRECSTEPRNSFFGALRRGLAFRDRSDDLLVCLQSPEEADDVGEGEDADGVVLLVDDEEAVDVIAVQSLHGGAERGLRQAVVLGLELRGEETGE